MAEPVKPTPTQDFERAAEEKAPSIVREFWDFVAHSKKWWLLPIVVLLLGLAVFLVASGTVAAPWLYTLF